MKTCLFLSLCLLFGSAALNLRADDEPKNELERLQTKVQRLEIENKQLQAEVNRWREQALNPRRPESGKRLVRDMDRLEVVRKELKAKPNDPKLIKEATFLGRRLAQSSPFPSRGWETLLEIGALKDGLTIEDAEGLLGPATSENEGWVDWYYNPMGRHVAPSLSATVGKSGLTQWKLDRR